MVGLTFFWNHFVHLRLFIQPNRLVECLSVGVVIEPFEEIGLLPIEYVFNFQIFNFRILVCKVAHVAARSRERVGHDFYLGCLINVRCAINIRKTFTCL